MTNQTNEIMPIAWLIESNIHPRKILWATEENAQQKIKELGKATGWSAFEITPLFTRAVIEAAPASSAMAIQAVDASEPEAKGNISAWLRRRAHNDLVMIPGRLAGQIADHIDSLQSKQPPVQASDAGRQG